MKTKLSIIALFTLLICASCEKEYTCTCREIDTNTGLTTNTWAPQKGTYSKSDATTWCHGQEVSGFGTEIKCDLK